jgi:hypothetical protein
MSSLLLFVFVFVFLFLFYSELLELLTYIGFLYLFEFLINFGSLNHIKIKMNPKSSLRSYIQSSNILECPICLQDYNLTNRQPMIICINYQTIHSICSECVTNKAFATNSTSKAYTCSICRKPIELNSIKKH